MSPNFKHADKAFKPTPKNPIPFECFICHIVVYYYLFIPHTFRSIQERQRNSMVEPAQNDGCCVCRPYSNCNDFYKFINDKIPKAKSV